MSRAPAFRGSRFLLGIGIGLVLLGILWTVYVLDYYRASRSPAGYRESGIAVQERTWGWYVSAEAANTDGELLLVYYPGGKVDEEAYIPLAAAFSERGVSTAVVRVPFRLAVFGINRYRSVLADLAPAPGAVLAIGGHSLGGAMAAVVADRDDQPFAALIIHGSYPPESSGLASGEIAVQSVWGARDSVAGVEQLRVAAGRLPEAAELVELPEGNHAGFGDYGPQDGDGEDSEPPGSQMVVAAALGSRFLSALAQESRSTE